ncbi:MAG: hypothetical protein Q9209_004828 [Squamulea sp. 1 TL-2023]
MSYSPFSSQSVYVDDFAVQQPAEVYENIRIITNVTIPDIYALSEAERHALCDKLEAEQDAAPTLNLRALDTKLLELSRQSPITPPPDHTANIARAHELEERSRKALQGAGCPACYPADLEFPLRNVPEKYNVVSYWQSLPGTGLVVLTAQLTDWTDSYEFQKRNRRYYVPRRAFPNFVDTVRHRRRRHGLEGDVHLLPNLEQQSQLQNWIEFQNYHLNLHEDEEMKTKDERDELDTSRKSLGTSGETISILEGNVKYGESKLEEHSKMLLWIEQQRKEMVAEQAASVNTTEDRDRSTKKPTSPSRSRWKRHQKSHSPLAPVRSAVSKKPSVKQRSLQPSKHDAPKPAENTIAASKEPRRSKRIAELDGKPSQCDVEGASLHSAQSVVRAKTAGAGKSSHPASTNTNVNLRRQPTAQAKRRKEPEQPSAGITKRRSKRGRRKFGRFGYDLTR